MDAMPHPQDTSTCIAIIERDLETTPQEPKRINFTDIVEKAVDGIFNTVWDTFNRGSLRNLLEQCGIESAKIDQLRDCFYLCGVALAWLMGEYLFVVESQPKVLELKALSGPDGEDISEDESDSENLKDSGGLSVWADTDDETVIVSEDATDGGTGEELEGEAEDGDSDEDVVPLEMILKALNIPITSCRIE